MSKNWQRARTDEQKEFRRQSILDSTTALFADKEYDQVSLALIAEGANMSKPNIYKYFDTKEDIFLTLVLEYSADHVEFQSSNMDDVAVDDVDGFCRKWVENVLQCDFFLRLSPRIAPTIERNCSVSTFYNYRKELSTVIEAGAEFVCSKLTGLTIEQGRMFMQYCYAFQAGWYSYLHPATSVKVVAAMAEFDSYRVDGKQRIAEALAMLVNGMLAKNA